MSENQKKALDQKIIQWVEQNFRYVLGLCGILLFGCVAVLVWSEWSKSQDQKIYSEIFIFKSKLDKATLEANNGSNFRDKSQSFYRAFKKDTPEPVYSDKMNQVALEYEKKIKNHINKKVAGFFVIDLADYFHQKGEIQKAQNLLALFLKDRKPKKFLLIVYMQLISYYMDQGNCSKALPLLDRIIKTDNARTFHSEAFVQKGVCYAKESKWDQAEKMYRSSLDLSEDPFHKKMMLNYLKVLKFNKKLNTK